MNSIQHALAALKSQFSTEVSFNVKIVEEIGWDFLVDDRLFGRLIHREDLPGPKFTFRHFGGRAETGWITELLPLIETAYKKERATEAKSVAENFCRL